MPTETAIRAATLILSAPLDPPPSATLYDQGLMMAGRPNPAFASWAEQVLERFRAFCVLESIPPAEAGGIDWMLLAYHLARKYEPRFKIKQKAGRRNTHDTPPAEMARRELAKLVAERRAQNPRLTVMAIAKNLEGKRVLPQEFRRMKRETLRKQIQRAEKEAVVELAFQKTLSELFKGGSFLSGPHSQSTHFAEGSPAGLLGFGLRASTPADKSG